MGTRKPWNRSLASRNREICEGAFPKGAREHRSEILEAAPGQQAQDAHGPRIPAQKFQTRPWEAHWNGRFSRAPCRTPRQEAERPCGVLVSFRQLKPAWNFPCRGAFGKSSPPTAFQNQGNQLSAKTLRPKPLLAQAFRRKLASEPDAASGNLCGSTLAQSKTARRTGLPSASWARHLRQQGVTMGTRTAWGFLASRVPPFDFLLRPNKKKRGRSRANLQAKQVESASSVRPPVRNFRLRAAPRRLQVRPLELR